MKSKDMRTIPTFIDDNYRGHKTMKDITLLRSEAVRAAQAQQAELKADHMIYCHYDLDDEGHILTVWLYSGIPMTDREFEQVSNLKNTFVGAIHRLK